MFVEIGQRRGFRIVVDGVDEAHAQSFPGADTAPGKQQILGPRPADPFRQQATGGGGEDRELDFGLAQHRAR